MIVKSYGKVLLTGGYLIIDPKNKGLVLSVNAPFKITIKEMPVSTTPTITFISPQFESTSIYMLEKNNDFIKCSKQSGGENLFIDSTISTFFKYTKCTIPTASFIFTLEGHNHFYGTQNQNKYYTKIDTHVKTGLGSSACLIVSLTIALTAICYHTEGPLKTWEKSIQKHVSYVAQISNAVAQKKIGSGFDIASALNGSIIFQRKGEIDKAMKSNIIEGDELTYDSFMLNKELKVVLIDMNSCADTRKMVKQVLDYVSAHSDKTEMFGTPSFKQLNSIYNQISEIFKKSTLSMEESRQITYKLHKALEDVTKETGANILPDESKTVLNKLMSLKSTLFCTVPGSGGPDAICSIGASSNYLDEVICITGKHAILLKARDGAKVTKI